MQDEQLLNLTNSALQNGDIYDLTLIGKILSAKVINFTAINVILSSSWNLGNNVRISMLEQNMISCHFSYAEDRDRILAKGPWAVKGAVLNLQKWPPHLPLEEIDFSTCIFWVQVHGLPLNKMNELNARKIGRFIGHFIQADVTKPTTHLWKFIRIRIAIDTTAPLKPGCMFHRDDGHQSWASFKYERLPDLCTNCGKLDHIMKACPIPRENQKDPTYGPWMKTPPSVSSAQRTPHRATAQVAKSQPESIVNIFEARLPLNDMTGKTIHPFDNPRALQSQTSGDIGSSSNVSLNSNIPPNSPHNTTAQLASLLMVTSPDLEPTEVTDTPTYSHDTVSTQIVSSPTVVEDPPTPTILLNLNPQTSLPIPSPSLTQNPIHSRHLKRKLHIDHHRITRSRTNVLAEVDHCFANMHIQPTAPLVLLDRSSFEVTQQLTHEEVCMEQHDTVVRRRVIHIKRMARSHHSRGIVAFPSNMAETDVSNVHEVGVAGIVLPLPSQ